jgi:hypothetical protein
VKVALVAVLVDALHSALEDAVEALNGVSRDELVALAANVLVVRVLDRIVRREARAGDATHLALLAISSRPPGAEQPALEIPEIECRRGGLGDLKRAWITLSEYNYDIAERSYYLAPDEPILGRFSKPFMMRLAAALAPLFARKGARVDRGD